MIGVEGAKALAESFTKNQSITKINLSNYIYIIKYFFLFIILYRF